MGTAARALAPLTLVVDDEELVCRMTARLLTEAGFRVAEAHSGAEAVALLATLAGNVRLVVSDISMPGMTGLDLTKILADQWPNLPVLLMSAQGGPDAGYSGPFLPKPFTADALLGAVAELLPTQQH